MDIEFLVAVILFDGPIRVCTWFRVLRSSDGEMLRTGPLQTLPYVVRAFFQA